MVLPERTAGETLPAQGTPAAVVTGRGGSYAPDTPRGGYEFVQNCLEAVLQSTLDLEDGFIVPELTMSPSATRPCLNWPPSVRPPVSAPLGMRSPGPGEPRRAAPRSRTSNDVVRAWGDSEGDGAAPTLEAGDPAPGAAGAIGLLAGAH
ncbi:hypothetical protein ABT124_39565 [Streptomyces sp. NPDC001982]|uniref:hypothetical protein n=1 Tax=Streptomyces sp. NPDC001982 TaxID=3154405 RepID=UPI003326D2B0